LVDIYEYMLSPEDNNLINIINTDDVENLKQYMVEWPNRLNDIMIYSHYSMTPLNYSLKINSTNCAKYLLNLNEINVYIPVYCSCGRCENKYTTAIYHAQTKELIQLVLTKYDICNIDVEGYKRLFNNACYNLSFDVVTFWVSFFETNTIAMSENFLTVGLQKVCESYKERDDEIEIFKFLIEKGADVEGGKDCAFRKAPIGLCILNFKKDLENVIRYIYVEKDLTVPSGKFPGYLPEEYICTVNKNDLKGLRMSTILRLFPDVDINYAKYDSRALYSRDFIKAFVIINALSELYTLPGSTSNLLICETSMVLSPGQKIKITDIVPKDYFETTDIIRLSHNTIFTDHHDIIYDSPIFFVRASSYSNAYVSLHKSITNDTLCHFDMIYLLDMKTRMDIATGCIHDAQNNIQYYSGMFSQTFQTTPTNHSTLTDRLHTILK
jgi:hypothetical protein